MAHSESFIVELTPLELKRMLESEDPFLLDVRDAEEWLIGRIRGSHHIPMRELPQRIGELPQERMIVCICHHGIRSATVCQYLLDKGFENVLNLSEGLHGWSIQVDPEVPLY